MKILFIVPYVPNLIRVRPFQLIRALTARRHQVTVLTLAEALPSGQDQADVARLRADCDAVYSLPMPRWQSLLNCVLALPTRQPLQAVYSWQPSLAQKSLELVFDHASQPAFDVVHVEHLRAARYGLFLQRQAASRRVPRDHRTLVVWDSVDCISLLFRRAASLSQNRLSRWLTRFELGRTEHFEAQLLDQFRHILVTSPMDQQAFQDIWTAWRHRLPAHGAERGGESRPGEISHVQVLPNGVDLDYFSPDPATARSPLTLVTSGKMSYHANVTMTLHLAREIMPRVWAHRPEVRLVVVGKDPPAVIQALADNPAIQVTGTVADMRPYLRQAAAAVLPIVYGVGIQNKVLEAMACATPVITTPQSVSALQALPGRDLLVAEDAPAFAQAVLRLLDDPARQVALGQAGRAYVEKYHRWDGIAEKLEGIYQAAPRAAQADNE